MGVELRPPSSLPASLPASAVCPDSASWAGSRRTRPDRARPSTPPCGLPLFPAFDTVPATLPPRIVSGSGSSATEMIRIQLPRSLPHHQHHPARPIPALRLIGQLMEPQPRRCFRGSPRRWVKRASPSGSGPQGFERHASRLQPLQQPRLREPRIHPHDHRAAHTPPTAVHHPSLWLFLSTIIIPQMTGTPSLYPTARQLRHRLVQDRKVLLPAERVQQSGPAATPAPGPPPRPPCPDGSGSPPASSDPDACGWRRTGRTHLNPGFKPTLKTKIAFHPGRVSAVWRGRKTCGFRPPLNPGVKPTLTTKIAFHPGRIPSVFCGYPVTL